MKQTVLSLIACVCLVSTAAAGPNIIFIITDDLGYGDIYSLYQHTRDDGAGGGTAGDGIRNGTEEPFIYTPNIDRMVAEGAKLTRHYTAAPVCAPARGSLLQGRDQGHANIRNNSFDKVVENNHTLGTVLKQAGYYTAALGKWGIGGSAAPWNGHPNDRGFDYYYGYLRHIWGHHHYPVPAPDAQGATVYENRTAVTNGLEHAYTTDLWTAKAKQIMVDRHENHPGTPFFIFLAYDTPHAQLQVPTQAYPAHPGRHGGLQWLGVSGQMINTASGVDDSYIHPDYTSLSSTSAKRHATMVRRIDHGVGDLLQTLRDLGIAENTLVVFTSDNGPHNEAGQGGSYTQDPRFFRSYADLEGIKRDEWEGGIREPTFAWWPTHIGDNNPATPGLDAARPSAFWDWMPTLAEAAGLAPPAWSSGVSLLPELTGAGAQFDRGYLYSEYSGGGSTPSYADFPSHGGAARSEMQSLFLRHDGDGKVYKGIRTAIASASDEFQIYDVDADPGEATNLAASLPDLQQRMKDKVLQVRIDGDYSRPYSSAYVTAAAPAATVNGLDYKAFTGTWDWVPETAYLTPDATGECTHLDLTMRTQDDHILLEFTGYLSVPADGTYTFQMTTDSGVGTSASGGMLWIHDAHIIDDDFNHTGAARSGTMRLGRGLHPLRVLYKHTTGNHDLVLRYSGPGIALQTVPDAALFREGVIPPGPPQAHDDAASTPGSTTDPGTSILIDVLANDIDDGTPGLMVLTDPGTARGGTAIVESGMIRYTPRQGVFGTDTFTYTMSDGAETDRAAVTVEIHAIGDALQLPLDETTGFMTRDAGGQPLGTLSGFVGDDSQWIDGVYCGALHCDGVDEQVLIDPGFYRPPLGAVPRSFTAWLKPSTGQPDYGAWLSYGANANGQRMTLRVDTGRLRCEVQGGFAIATTVVADGAWHHVAVVIDDFDDSGDPDVGEVRFYVDGNPTPDPISSSSSRSIHTVAGPALTIGGSSHSASYNYSGGIDDLRVYASALSGAEIQALASRNACEDAWYFRHLGDPEPARADWDADTEDDGYCQFLEFALGGSPHWFEPAMAPVLEWASPGVHYLFNRRIALGPGAYVPECSNDFLPPWDSLSGATAVAHPDLPGFERVTVPLPDDGEPHRFVRLGVTH